MTQYSRTAEREKTMQALYQVFLYLEAKSDFDATDVIVSQYGVKTIDEVPVFSKAVYALALEHLEDIEALIQSHLVNWAFSRLDNVAKAILVEAISEGNYGHLSPRKVVISQAVLLAKQYLDPGQHKFINAVLDKSLTAYECPEN
jgi:transcription antitermination factor NusB